MHVHTCMALYADVLCLPIDKVADKVKVSVNVHAHELVYIQGVSASTRT